MAQGLAVLLLGVVTTVAVVTDWRTGKIYNWLTYPAMLLGLAYWTIWGYAAGGLEGAGEGFASTLTALLVGLVPFTLLAAVRMFGMGDAKLYGCVGAITGSWICVLNTVIYACIVALLMGLAIMITRRLTLQTFQRIYILLLSSAARVKPTEFKDSPKLPYAIPIMIGSLVAAVEHLLDVKYPWSAWSL